MKKLSLVLIALMPILASAKPVATWNSTPKIVLITDQDSKEFSLDIGFTRYDLCKLSDGSSSRCKATGGSVTIPLANPNDAIDMVLHLSSQLPYLEISRFHIYGDYSRILPSCELLNYDVSGKSRIVITVDKYGCQVS